MQRQLRLAQVGLKSQLEDSKFIVLENDHLREQLQTTKRELESIVNLNLKHTDVTRPNQNEEGRASDNQDGSASAAEIMELKNRAHLLTEENNVLFEQISVLRAHYDQFNKDHQLKMDQANRKLAAVDKLNHDLQSLLLQRDNLARTSQALDHKLQEASLKLAATEEGRKKDQTQLMKTQEQLSIISKQYHFYKDICDDLQHRQSDELETLNKDVRQMTESEKDLKFKNGQLDSENKELSQQNRVLVCDL